MSPTGESNPFRLSRGVLLFQLFTVSRLCFAAAFAAMLFLKEATTGVLWTCVALLAAAELTDIFDGLLARKFGLVSEFGAMLDPYIDSVSRLLIFWALASADLVLAFVPVVMALRDITVAHLRIILTHRGRSVGAKWSGKIKAQVQGTGSFLAVLGPFYWAFTGTWPVTAVSWIVVLVTVGSVVEYAVTAVRRSR